MRRRDFKEVWQDYYDEAEEMGEADPGKYADSQTADYFANLADYLHDARRDA